MNKDVQRKLNIRVIFLFFFFRTRFFFPAAAAIDHEAYEGSVA